jgi:hypothetical protein
MPGFQIELDALAAGARLAGARAGRACLRMPVARRGFPDFLESAIGIMPSREKTQSSGASIFGVGRLPENLR